MRITFSQYDEIKPLSDLHSSPHQRNRHPKEQIKRLAKIMKTHGVRHPIHLSKRTNTICFGHGRKEAALMNGWTEFPVVYQDFESDDEEYIVVQSDNAIAAWADLDLSGINTDIGHLGPFDVELFGIEGFVVEPIEKLDPQCDEDEVPEVKESFVKLGDIWQLGNHRLMCGDSTLIDSVEELMAGEKADMVFTDPPYGMNFQSNFREQTPQFDKLVNDDKILDIAPIVWMATKDTSISYICTRWDVYPEWYNQFSQYDLKNCVVWFKRGGGMGDLAHAYSPNHEFIIVAHKGINKLRGKRHPDVWEIGKDGVSTYVHPTQKPVELSSFAIQNHSDSKDAVLDLFGGSGSTLIACEKTNRRCIMMELDPHYCAVIIERWQKYTGEQAVRLNGKTT